MFCKFTNTIYLAHYEQFYLQINEISKTAGISENDDKARCTRRFVSLSSAFERTANEGASDSHALLFGRNCQRCEGPGGSVAADMHAGKEHVSDNTLTLECNKREVRDDVARRAKCGNKRPFRAVAFGYSAKSSFHEIGNGGAFGGIGRIFRANDERFGEVAF